MAMLTLLQISRNGLLSLREGQNVCGDFMLGQRLVFVASLVIGCLHGLLLMVCDFFKCTFRILLVAMSVPNVFFYLWLFAAASVSNISMITDISFLYQFKSIL